MKLAWRGGLVNNWVCICIALTKWNGHIIQVEFRIKCGFYSSFVHLSLYLCHMGNKLLLVFKIKIFIYGKWDLWWVRNENALFSLKFRTLVMQTANDWIWTLFCTLTCLFIMPQFTIVFLTFEVIKYISFIF